MEDVIENGFAVHGGATASIESLKRRAKEIKAQCDLSHSQCLELAAKEEGFSTYAEFRRAFFNEKSNVGVARQDWARPT